MRKRTRIRTGGALALAVFGGGIARASDGVVEINQTCATQTGCVPGDSPGFPVTLSTAGSYRLTSVLITPLVGGANTTLIEVTGANVDLDLNDFGLRGFVTCSGVPASCNVSGSGRGVDGSASGTSIHDGFVTGMGSNGIFASTDARIRNVTAVSNAGNGIFASAGSLLEDVVASSNGGSGIALGGMAIVRNGVARANGALGFSLLSNGQASGLVAASNGSHGISAGTAAEVADCTATGNGGDGVHVGTNSTVRHCTARSNQKAGVFASGTALGESLHSEDNGRYSLEGPFFYRESLLGCSSGSFAATDAQASGIGGTASNVLLACTGT
ncbi:MAG: right-handed parallel beta-helix repeat-containing protein [Myxococcota bacterium]